MSSLKILYLEDAQYDVEILREHLEQEKIDFHLIHASNRENYVHALENNELDIILADFSLPSFDGFEALNLTQQMLPDIPFIIISGVMGEELAIEALKSGATDYVLKQRMGRLIPSIRRAMLEANERRERKMAENAKQKYDFIVNASKSMFTLIDKGFKYEAVNDAFCRAHKLVREKIIGRTLTELWGEENFTNHIRNNFEKSFRNNVVRYQAWFEVPSHGMRCFEVTFYPYKEHGTEVTHTVVDTMDITDKQKAQDALRESEARYRMLFDHAAEAIFLEKDNRIQTCNARALEFFGYTKQALRKKSVLDLSVPTQSDGTISRQKAGEFLTASKNGEPVEFKWEFQRKDKSAFKAEVSLASFNLKGDQFFQYFIHDITEKARMQGYLRQAQKMETIGTLAGGIAHDFNNIIATIMGHADIAIQEVKAGHPAHEDLEQIVKATHRAKGLVEQILTFSRQVETKPEKVNLTGITSEAIKLLGASIPNNIQIRQEMDAACKGIIADPSQLHQVIMNICTNAIYAMKDSGGTLKITSSCTSPDEELQIRYPSLTADCYHCIKFRDTGKGMDQDVLERIFEPFFTTKPVGEGTGLGLSVVHGIVKKMKGEITAQSTPGKGTTITVMLPCIDEKK